MSVCCNSHQICTSGLTFYHIGECFFIQIILRQNTDHKCSVLDQADRSMLQFPCCISFGMDIRNLLHLQRSFQTDRIVDTTSDKEYVMCIGKLCRKPLETFFIFHDLFDLIRNCLKLIQILLADFIRYFSSYHAKLDRKQVRQNKLCCICLCCCNRNLRSSHCIADIISLSCDRRTDYIDDRQGFQPLLLCFPERCQSICRLTGL